MRRKRPARQRVELNRDAVWAVWAVWALLDQLGISQNELWRAGAGFRRATCPC